MPSTPTSTPPKPKASSVPPSPKAPAADFWTPERVAKHDRATQEAFEKNLAERRKRFPDWVWPDETSAK